MVDMLCCDTAVQMYVGILVFVAGLLGERHAALGDLILKIVSAIRGKKAALAFAGLCLFVIVEAGAGAADLGPVITTTDGRHYKRAADGCYYPTFYTPAAQPAGKLCDCCEPSCTCRPGKKNPDCTCYPCHCAPAGGYCGGGCCAPAAQQPPVIYYYYAAPSAGCPSCQSGRCRR